MITVAVAGGRGKLGRAIVEILVEDGRYRVVVLSRDVNKEIEECRETRVVQVDYRKVEDLAKKLEINDVHTVISTMGSGPGFNPDVNLIEAAEKAASTKRFVPSMWGFRVTEDIAESFDFAKPKLAALNALERSSLEYTAFVNGFFMDYFLAPHVKTNMDPIAVVLDILNNSAAIPGSGDVPVVFSYTFDIARYVVAALSLSEWEKESYVIGDKATWNQFLRLCEEAKGVKFCVVHDTIENLHQGRVSELPSHSLIYPFYPKVQLQGLLSSFGLMFELGYFDMSPSHTMNERFPEIKTMSIQQLLRSWQENEGKRTKETGGRVGVEGCP